jgi:hypothetical protein
MLWILAVINIIWFIVIIQTILNYTGIIRVSGIIYILQCVAHLLNL